MYGIHPVRQALRVRPDAVHTVYLQEGLGEERRRRLADALAAAPPVTTVPAAELARLTGSTTHQGVAALVEEAGPLGEAEAHALVRRLDRPLLLVLDGLQDPRNFGACLRTADAAGVDLVVVPRSRNVELTPTVSKVAAGAAETQTIVRVGNLARFLGDLRNDGAWIAGMDAAAAQPLYEADLTVGLALVLGAEGEGLRRLTRERCDYLVRLPMYGAVESLNVAVAAGICLYEALRQRLPGGAHLR